MATVLQLTKALVTRPEPIRLPTIGLRTYHGPENMRAWLELRSRAFARQKLGVRAWSEADFAAEFLAKSWWRPDWMWFAERQTADGLPQVVGSVTLAIRGHEPATDDRSSSAPPKGRGVVHWLMVSPRERRGGIGRLLMATLEAAAWDAGFRQVSLETHAAWSEAAQFYAALGYHEAAAH